MNLNLPGSRRWRRRGRQYVVQRRPAVQDEDHAYDLRHDAAQVWGLTTGTYYAQALLRCHDALIPQNDAFRLCVVVTDTRDLGARHLRGHGPAVGRRRVVLAAGQAKRLVRL